MAKIKPQALLQQSKKKKGPSQTSASTIVLYGIVVILLVFLVLASYRHWIQRSRVETSEELPVRKKLGAYDGSKRSDVPRYAILNTSKGMITVELYKDGAPDAFNEFIDACKNGQFKGIQFHRVIKKFVIQGGDSERNGVTEDWTSRGKHYNQLDTSVKHEAFMMGTSKGKHDKEGFELVITTAPIPDLNEKLNLFGRVIKGEDVVQEIEEVDTDEHYRPKSSIGIIDVKLEMKI
ncbi:Peptidyl-prolyl cis-trans isomerase [Heracleum sosnowskyi]|uniref:Peptidyl-prolyl cis-trans isomerase n=1 Tax=Heracleum sosnowskyi TaxID=360622 RepID=A0AAD8IFN1_9APIA|nr:Peptidyl-prolyl cis-trans isomerase [Heracleum sosnowskyi]